MNLPTTWGEWIVKHPNADALDDNITLVSEAARKANNVAKYVDLLCENENIVMMTKAAMGKNLQFSFLHKSHGSTLLSRQKAFIAVKGFEQGTAIEMDTQHLHKQTNKTDSPSFSAILDTANPANPANLANLRTSSNDQVRFKSSVLLTPFLVYRLINEPDLSIENIFRILTTRIKQKEEQLFFEKKDDWKTANNIAEDNEDENALEPLRLEIRAESEISYSDVIFFLFKLATNEGAIHATICIPATSMDKQQ